MSIYSLLSWTQNEVEQRLKFQILVCVIYLVFSMTDGLG